jgi:hypothetical protein
VPILVDGNNLLHRLPSGQRNRAALRRLCLELVRRENAQLTVVFDGAPPPGGPPAERLGRVTILYAAPRSADDAILAALPPPPASASWVVVSDDRQLRERARRAGARLRSLLDWLPKLSAAGHPRPGEQPLSAAEVAEWEALFAASPKSDK